MLLKGKNPRFLASRGVAQPGSASGLGPEGRKFESYCPDHNFMKKAKIYNPSKTAMQSGTAKTKYWILEFNKENFETDYLMGWNASRDTQKQVKLKFESKEEAINYANKHNILFDLLESKKRKIIIKSYADNFLKN